MTETKKKAAKKTGATQTAGTPERELAQKLEALGINLDRPESVNWGELMRDNGSISSCQKLAGAFIERHEKEKMTCGNCKKENSVCDKCGGIFCSHCRKQGKPECIQEHFIRKSFLKFHSKLEGSDYAETYLADDDDWPFPYHVFLEKLYCVFTSGGPCIDCDEWNSECDRYCEEGDKECSRHCNGCDSIWLCRYVKDQIPSSGGYLHGRDESGKYIFGLVEDPWYMAIKRYCQRVSIADSILPPCTKTETA